MSETEQKSLTNWYAFTKAKLVPKEIICNAYRHFHHVDMSCHTRLQRDVETLLRHIPEHGGGFTFALKESEKEWPGWAEFATRGIEIQDFRCEVCNEVLPLASQRLLHHMKSHKNENRKIVPGGVFGITIGTQKPISADDDEQL